jgi:hypothetical protein
MKKRDFNHYLNINERVNSTYGRLKKNKSGVIFSQNLFGIMGTIKHINTK